MIKQDLISNVQVVTLVSLNLIGAALLALPRAAVEASGVAAPVTTLAAGGLALVLTYFTASLCRIFPKQTLGEFSRQTVGTIVTKIILFILFIYFLGITGLEIRYFGAAAKSFLLSVTPLEAVLIPMLFSAVYLVQYGISPIARITELFFLVIIGALALLLAAAIQQFRIDELYPSFANGLTPIIKGIPDILTAYLGFEVILFLGPFTKEPQKIVKYSIIGVLIPVILYTLTVAVTIGAFGPPSVLYQLFPGLSLARASAFPGAFLERFDIAFIGVWMLAAFTTTAIYYYLAAVSLTRILGLRHYRPFVWLLAPVVYIVALIPKDFVMLETYFGLLAKTGAIIVTLIIMILLLIARFQKKGGEN